MNAIAQLSQIRDRRVAIRAELRGLLDKHADNPPDEVRAREDALTAEADRLDADEQAALRRARVDDLDRRSGTGTPLGGGGTDASFEALAAKTTLCDAIRAQLGIVDEGSSRAKEVSQELARRSGRTPQGIFYAGAARPATENRVFTTTTPAGGPGGNLIATDIRGPLIDRLREKLIVRSLGALVLSDLTGNIAIPRLKTSAQAQWIAENAPLTVTDVATDQAPGAPKIVGGLCEVSRLMVLQPSLDVTAMIESDLTQILAAAIDAAALAGAGGLQPVGILNPASGVTLLHGGTAGLAPSWGNISALISAIDVANALTGRLGFATNGRVAGALRTTLKTPTDTASTFLLDEGGTLAGFPLVTSQLVPNTLTRGAGSGLSPLIFADWSQLCICFWGPEIDILVNPFAEVPYSKGNIQIRGLVSADVIIRQPAAFAVLDDVIAT